MYADYSYEQAMTAIDWVDESDSEDWPEDLWDD